MQWRNQRRAWTEDASAILQIRNNNEELKYKYLFLEWINQGKGSISQRSNLKMELERSLVEVVEVVPRSRYFTKSVMRKNSCLVR